MLCNIGRIGDTILSNSILDSAFRTYANVDYLCGKANAELVRSDVRLNRVTVLSNSVSGFLNVASAAMRSRYDGFIGLKDCYSRTNLFLAQLFRSRVKTGWNAARFRPFNRDVRSISVAEMHKVDVMRRIGELAGLKPGEYKPCLTLSSNSIDWFRRNYAWDKPFIFLNVSATSPNRMWPAENWDRYLRGCGLVCEPIIINGLPRHQNIVRQLCSRLPGAVALQPKNFMDVAASIADSRMVLTVDTGVVHACSAFNKPVVALYVGGKSIMLIGPLSTRRLVIQARPGFHVPDIDPEFAIAETQRYGLP